MKSRAAQVKWNGSLKGGGGKISAESGAFQDLPYSFSTRFEDESGTNPEELIAAAHAACFSMALSGELQKQKFIADEIDVSAHVKIEKPSEDSWQITNVELVAQAIVPNCTPAQFKKAAETAKTNCPVSKLLNAAITLEARLVSPPLEAVTPGPV